MKIVIDVPVFEAGLTKLQSLPRVDVCLAEPAERARPLDEALIGDASVLFCMYPPENFSAMRQLRWIQLSTAGYSQLFPLGLADKSIRATNARGCFDVPIAEWNIAMMVNLARNLRQMIRNQDSAVWDRAARFQREIRGLTVGVWGYGGIGRETARLARAMGMRVHVLSRHGVGPAGEVYCVPGTGDPQGTLPHRVFLAGEAEAFLAGLDFLVLTMPLTRTTEGSIGERELRALPRRAYVLNPARGPLIQEGALLRALREGWIAGAALDTHYHYPTPPDHPLWRFPNVIFTPHISGSSLSPHFRERTWDIFVENVERFLAGRPLLNELTPSQLNGT
ncbi:MAG TPA: D-2-hydroxyacid dehydrogenase [Bryobacteraceae bacterium]|nr:D-2-hydroxyacid dehydrogenase [Bryobacteraceae bacterium]